MVMIVVSGIGVTVLMDYMDPEFDFSIFLDPSYWVNVAVINAAVVLLMLTVRSYCKNKEMTVNADVVALSGQIDKMFSALSERKLHTELEAYVAGINYRRKLKAYTDRLKRRLYRTKNERRKVKFTKLLETAETDVKYLRVRYHKVSSSELFSKLELKRENDEILSFQEAKAVGNLILHKALGIVAFGLVGASMIPNYKEVTVYVVFNTVFKLLQIGMSLYVGASDGIDFVRSTVLDKLKLRLKFVQQFLENRNHE